MSQLAAFKGINNISRHTHHSHNFRSKRPFKWLWNSPEVCPRRVSPKKKSCRAGTIRCSPLSASKLPVKGKLLTYQEQPGVQKPLCAVDWPSIRQCKTYIYICTPLHTMFFHFQVVACFEVGKWAFLQESPLTGEQFANFGGRCDHSNHAKGALAVNICPKKARGCNRMSLIFGKVSPIHLSSSNLTCEWNEWTIPHL